VTAATLHPRLLIGSSIAMYVAVLVGLLVFEHPGLGLGHFFYIPIAIIAVASGPRIGALAGVIAAVLYAVAIFVNPSIPTVELVAVSTPIRLITFATCGFIVGWFAHQNRELIQRLELLAQRDQLTGLPNVRAFEAAVDRRFAAGEQFAVLLGDLDGLREANEAGGHGEGDIVLVQLAETLGTLLRGEEEVARVGSDEFAVLASLRGKDAAAQRANQLEQRLAQHGLAVTFGWAAYPDEGNNALGLIRVADERLYARKLVRGRRTGEPQLPKVLTA
jgi:diguanylate cyclase